MHALRIYVAHIYQLSDLTYVQIKRSLITTRLVGLVNWILIGTENVLPKFKKV